MLSRLIKIVGSIGLLSLISAAPALAQYPSPTYNNLTILGTCTGCNNSAGTTSPFFNGTGTNPFRVSGTTIVDSSRNGYFANMAVAMINGIAPSYGADPLNSGGVSAGGTGYSNGDFLTLTDGCAVSAKIGVHASGGIISGFDVMTPGVCLTPPVNSNSSAPLSATGGTGTGATFLVAYGINAASLNIPTLTSNNTGNLFLNSEQVFGIGGTENTFVGVRAGSGFGGNTSFSTCMGHDACGRGSGKSVNGQSVTAVGTDALRNMQSTTSGGGAFNNIDAFGADSLMNLGLNVNVQPVSISAFGKNSGVNLTACNTCNVALFGPFAGSGASSATYSNVSAFGSHTGQVLSSAHEVLILAGGSTGGVDTCTSCSDVIDILSGAATSTVSATATHVININNVIRSTGVNAPSTSVTSVAGELLLGSAAPTVASGFGTSPAIAGSNGYAGFSITVGTGGSDSSGILTMPFTAAHGWACQATDITTQSTTVFATRQIATGSSTTAVALTNFSSVMAAAAWAASDVLVVNCQPY